MAQPHFTLFEMPTSVEHFNIPFSWLADDGNRHSTIRKPERTRLRAFTHQLCVCVFAMDVFQMPMPPGRQLKFVANVVRPKRMDCERKQIDNKCFAC